MTSLVSSRSGFGNINTTRNIRAVQLGQVSIVGVISSILSRRKKVESRHSAVAMPMFSHVSPPDIGAALDWIRQRFPDCPPIGHPDGSDNTFTASIPGGQIGITFVPAAIPSGDLDGPTALAWHWPSAGVAVQQHVAHEICFASSSEMDRVALRLLHSRVIAGIAAVGQASAVYVGSSMLIREGPVYVADIEQADRDNLPVFSWLGFIPVAGDRGQSVYTTGLREFELLELEIRNSSLQWDGLFEFLANIAHYEIASSIQIGDGETVGLSEDRLLVTHQSSEFIPDTTVACIS
jgi:hypothetical protein